MTTPTNRLARHVARNRAERRLCRGHGQNRRKRRLAARCDQLEPALAIIDYLMPGMNGAEVARQVRLRTPDLPIIFISGYADSHAIDAIPRAPAAQTGAG